MICVAVSKECDCVGQSKVDKGSTTEGGELMKILSGGFLSATGFSNQ
jgi:hypothetical protein